MDEIEIPKFLIKQNDDYYMINNNYQKLGVPISQEKLEEWYTKYGTNDIGIITQELNKYETKMINIDEENKIYKTEFELDANEIKDSIGFVDDNNIKKIVYGINSCRIIDKLDTESYICMHK